MFAHYFECVLLDTRTHTQKRRPHQFHRFIFKRVELLDHTILYFIYEFVRKSVLKSSVHDAYMHLQPSLGVHVSMIGIRNVKLWSTAHNRTYEPSVCVFYAQINELQICIRNGIEFVQTQTQICCVRCRTPIKLTEAIELQIESKLYRSSVIIFTLHKYLN